MDRKDRDPSRKERLVDAGRDLFATKGFHGTSVRDIAAEAGVNVSLVSYYFGGKEQLYSAVVEELTNRIRSIMSEEAISGLTPREKVRYYAENVLAMHRENPHLAKIMHREMNSPSPVLEDLRQTLFPQVFRFVHGIFEEGIRKGDFRNDLDPAAMAYSLASLMNFYHFQRFLVYSMNPAFLPGKDSEVIGQALEIFLNGVNAPEGGSKTDENQ